MALWLANNTAKAFSCVKQFVTTSVYNSQSSDVKQTNPKPGNTNSPDLGIKKVTTLTALHKWALVFSGKYKNKADIPQYVPIEVLEKARSKARIKVSNYLMLLTLVGCLSFAYSGRKAAERGESVSKMNLDWHREYQEKVAKEKLEAQSK